MSINKILVPLSGQFAPDDPGSLDAPALETGARLARHLGARADVLCVIGPRGAQAAGWVSWMPDYGMDTVLDAMERQAGLRRRNAKKSFERLIKPQVDSGELRASFVEKEGEIGATVGAAGRLSDLIVVASSQSRWEQPFRPILDASLRQTGRAVFIAPPVAPEKTGENIAIAWNDTREAARALAQALPLLKRAAAITVLCCREDNEQTAQADPDAVVEYLALHGVKATSREFPAKHRRAAREIIDAASAEGADLLVLGSVIHSRAHSLVYGSLTEEVLKAPKMSALLVP